MDSLLNLILISVLSVISLFIIAKILGKKQVSQLEFIDYVIGISIGSIAAEMATDISDKPFYYYLLAMAIYFLFDLSITLFARKSPTLKHFFKGKPITIIYNGEILYKNLKKSKLDINDLLTLSRSEGYFNLEDIAFAIFENNGKLSIMPKEENRPTLIKDIEKAENKAELPVYLIVDGIISMSSINEINKDKKWLFNKLKITKKKHLKNIILASYNREEDIIIVTDKNQKKYEV